MTQNIEDLHVYLRSIRPNERTSLSVLASLVHEGATVLDLGCGSGALGQYLQETLHCTCDGLTWSEAEAALARPHYRHVVVADLEACDLLTTFTTQHYDYIVCADVLEHLRAPERVLAACRDLLKPSGRLLISVPNAGYAGLVAELLQGEFRYREEGLLDRTHLRFFTRRSLARFMGEQRWAVDSLDTIHREMPESEFKTQFDQLPPSVARYLLAAPDALSYQFVGAAHPVDMAAPEQLDMPPAAEAQALFTAQLYLGQGGSYAEDRKLTARGIIGQERQTLRFPIAAAEAATTHLRLDPADRPGFLHLYAISLRDDQGVERWRWDASTATGELLSGALHRQIEWQSPLAPAAPASLLLLTGEDPWFQLPVDPQTVVDATAAGGSLEVEVGWPMSADYLALSATVRPLQDQIDQTQRLAHAAQDRLKGEMGHLESQLSQTRDALAVAHDANARLHETNEQLMAQRSELREESSLLQRNATRQQYDLARLQAEHGALVAQFKTLENSLVYRATRPLASAKRGLNQLLGRTAAPSPAAALPSQHPQPPTPHPVDVIVPVYRGLADTQLCIDSVLASPLRAAYRLIVINDCSPEPEVTQWLRERAAQDARITLLENSENLGFVGTVNRGMALSDSNDVLLLNSDTEVANDWLDRIRAAAYGDARIASVTPLSTNATICSYPRFCEDNPLPPGYDTARLDALCARTNPGVVVDVPTGVGFCMYIRRDSLHALGLFDTEHFGKGYGEENDFCQRAVHAGWRNLHLLDTFVLHTGGVSFGDSKSPRERAAMETLARLHPNYARDVHAFVQADPARPYRLALDVARILDAHLPVVLAVLHDRAGGTVRHVRELSTHLAAQAQFLTLTPTPGHSVALRMASEREGFELRFRLEDQFDDLLGVLRSLGVCHVHYHHLLGHGQQVRDLPALLDVPYDFTAHDFYSYCTHITLTGDEERFTGDAAPGQCNCCTPDMASPMGGSVAQWRSANALLLNGARHVFAPSHDTARRIAGLVPAAKVLAVPHTDMAPDTDLPAPQLRPLLATQALKVVVIGALSVIKGADVLEAVAREAAKRQAPVEFHLLGYAYRQLQTQPKAHLTVHGAYTEEDLPRLLAWLQPDIVWFPAQWPETYSYTLSAALQAGLPVAVPDIGAFAERVATRPWSWVCDWNLDTKQWVEFFTTLRTEHFAQAIPPALPAVQAVDPVQSQPDAWSYRSDYVKDLPPRRAEGASLDHAQLLRYLPTPTPTAAARSRLFSALVYLRSLPVLRSVARRIPAHWQRKVKSRLIA